MSASIDRYLSLSLYSSSLPCGHQDREQRGVVDVWCGRRYLVRSDDLADRRDDLLGGNGDAYDPLISISKHPFVHPVSIASPRTDTRGVLELGLVDRLLGRETIEILDGLGQLLRGRELALGNESRKESAMSLLGITRELGGGGVDEVADGLVAASRDASLHVFSEQAMDGEWVRDSKRASAR